MTDPPSNEMVREANKAAPTKYTQHTTSVRDLRAALAELPDDAVVVLAKDGEGNGFSPLSLHDPLGLDWYVPDSTWSGEVSPIGEDADGEIYEQEGGELYAVVLWPTN